MPTSPSLRDAPIIAERYRVVRELGEGGMGVVYEVIDETTNRRRALKRIRAHAVLDPELVRRFELEVTIAGRVESEHVVEVLDAGIDAVTQAPYIVMELLTGEDLGALIAREGGLGAGRALEIFEQLARGLARTHAEGIVHRDIKPENVFLSGREDGSIGVKLLDFGVAKSLALDTLSPATTRIVGTPLYMAPEQFSGDGTIDARADVYALGQLAFTVLVGTPYFEDERRKRFGLPSLAMAIAAPSREAASARAHARGVTLPPGFDDWFRGATEPEPEARFATVELAYERLREVLDPRATVVRELAATAEPEHGRRSRGGSARAAVVIAAVVLAIAGYVWWSGSVEDGSDSSFEAPALREVAVDEGVGEALVPTEPLFATEPLLATEPPGATEPLPATEPLAQPQPGGEVGVESTTAPPGPATTAPATVEPSPAAIKPSLHSPNSATTASSAIAPPAASAPAVPYDPLQDL